MDYQNTLKYLYESAPMFQQIGGKAYKSGLDTTYRLDEHFDHPHQQFKTIHIAGTNGKGSCSHTIAAVLQSAGYRVGLYTSPHLIDFRERIRINGEMIAEDYVVRFVEEHRSFFEPLHPSFFELTTAMAFRYFADQEVDVAVIEVGMGGRLDCTNIITPELCVITNIGYDHMQHLGETLPKIAKEKAGIIKKGIPVIVGRAAGWTKRVIAQKAKEMEAPITYASNLENWYTTHHMSSKEMREIITQLSKVQELGKKMQEMLVKKYGSITMRIMEILALFNPVKKIQIIEKLIEKNKKATYFASLEFPLGLYFELYGYYQKENGFTILATLNELKKLGYKIQMNDFEIGFANVCEMTGLMGRWQKLQSYPDIICDTGHNIDGLLSICNQLNDIHENSHKNLHIVFGMVNDKDIDSILPILPKHATYYFTKASVKRALPEEELKELAIKAGLTGNAYPTVVEAVKAAKKNCPPSDFIFVGGSSFVVADLLANRDALNFH